jgi:cytoskeletal protein CcmA (bactofilin family)
MKKFAVAMLLVAGLTLAGCGSNNPGNINGNWTATLTGSQNFTFTTSLVSNSDGTVTVTKLSFSSNSCFVSGETETGTFAVGGNFNGNVTGTFGLIVQSGTPSGNVLTLKGNVTGNTITGNWTLAGGGNCNGSGTFTMNKS